MTEQRTGMPGGRVLVTVFGYSGRRLGAFKRAHGGGWAWKRQGGSWREAPGVETEDGARGCLMTALDAMEVE